MINYFRIIYITLITLNLRISCPSIWTITNWSMVNCNTFSSSVTWFWYLTRVLAILVGTYFRTWTFRICCTFWCSQWYCNIFKIKNTIKFNLFKIIDVSVNTVIFKFLTFVTTDEWITRKTVWTFTNGFMIIDCTQCSRRTRVGYSAWINTLTV